MKKPLHVVAIEGALPDGLCIKKNPRDIQGGVYVKKKSLRNICVGAGSVLVLMPGSKARSLYFPTAGHACGGKVIRGGNILVMTSSNARDAAALAGDWRKVGGDISDAIGKASKLLVSSARGSTLLRT